MVDYFLTEESENELSIKNEQQKMKIYQKLDDKLIKIDSIKKNIRVRDEHFFSTENYIPIIDKYISCLKTKNEVDIKEEKHIYSLKYRDFNITGLTCKIFYKKNFTIEIVEDFSVQRDDEFFDFIWKYQHKNIDEYILRYFANIVMGNYMIKENIKILEKDNLYIKTDRGIMKYRATFDGIVIYIDDREKYIY